MEKEIYCKHCVGIIGFSLELLPEFHPVFCSVFCLEEYYKKKIEAIRKIKR